MYVSCFRSLATLMFVCCSFYGYGDHRELHVLTHAFPTLRSSDLTAVWDALGTTIKSIAPQQLMTFHPIGRTDSSWQWHDAKWLDFNMLQRSEEHTSELQSLMRISYAVFCLKNKHSSTSTHLA